MWEKVRSDYFAPPLCLLSNVQDMGSTCSRMCAGQKPCAKVKQSNANTRPGLYILQLS